MRLLFYRYLFDQVNGALTVQTKIYEIPNEVLSIIFLLFEDKREVIVILLKFLVRKIYTELFESVPLFRGEPRGEEEKERKKKKMEVLQDRK